MEKVDRAIEILQAFKNGEIIIVDYGTSEITLNRIEDVLVELGRNNSVRIKKQPKYRPCNSKEEFFNASKEKEHGPYITKDYHTMDIPIRISDGGVAIMKYNTQFLRDNSLDLEFIPWLELFNEYKWSDGTPCGILEE